MPFCDYCEEEFDNMSALARHIKKVHGQVAVKKEAEGDTHACPVCLLKQKWTSAIAQNLAVCPRCLTWYMLDSGKLAQPPPERCVAERLGFPCTAPEHKKYWRLYTESLANIK